MNYSLRTSVFKEGAASEEELLRVVKSTLENEGCKIHKTWSAGGTILQVRRMELELLLGGRSQSNLFSCKAGQGKGGCYTRMKKRGIQVGSELWFCFWYKTKLSSK